MTSSSAAESVPGPAPRSAAAGAPRSAPWSARRAGESGEPQAAGTEGTQAAPRRRFRPEIQGLRAFAVVLVAVYHIWFGRVSGGVDVFLFISAFLMSLSFTGKLERGQRVGWKVLSTYWVHVFKRILPLAVITVVSVLIAARLLLEPERWETLIREAVSVLLYCQNWFSIAQQVDYYAADSGAASPLRHFWSLSVQGQIFLLWPLLFALGGLIARIFRLRARPVLAVVFGAVFIASLTYSVIETRADQLTAYFNTFARLWEFALGTLVAIVLPWFRAPGGIRALMSWVGVAAIVTCGWLLDVQGAFPGWIALWPTGAAALVILAGQSGRWWGIDRLLSWGPLVALGGYSYALYLLHWPILVIYLSRNGLEKADFMGGMGVLGLSLAGAVVLTRAVETPLSQWSWPERSRLRSLAVVAACLILGLGAAGGWQARINYVSAKAQADAWKNNPGARILEPGYEYVGDEDPTLLPLSIKRTSDWARNDEEHGALGRECAEVEPERPLYGMGPESCYKVVTPENPTQKMVAVGNSHTEQWMSALRGYAQERDIELTFVRHVGCFYTVHEDNHFWDECQRWLADAESYLQDEHPDTLVIQSTFSTYDGREEHIRTGTEDQVAKWTDAGVTVLGIRDNPRFTESHIECEQAGDPQACLFADHPSAVNPDPTADWEQRYPGYAPVEFNDLICPDGICPPAVGNVYTYADNNHLTATFVRSTQPFFDARTDEALDRAEQEREDAQRREELGLGEDGELSDAGIGYGVDEYGNPVDQYGSPVDVYGNPVDVYGNPVDEDGSLLDPEDPTVPVPAD